MRSMATMSLKMDNYMRANTPEPVDRSCSPAQSSHPFRNLNSSIQSRTSKELYDHALLLRASAPRHHGASRLLDR